MRKIKPEIYDDCVPSMKRSLTKEEHYPHFNISIDHLPEAKKWEIGNTYYVTLELKQTSIEINKNEDKESGYVGFDITAIDVEGSRIKKGKKYDLPDKD